MKRFTDMIAFEPAHIAPRRPTAEQIAATGAALPAGAHRLTDEQQRAWFGGVAFLEPVAWNNTASVFVAGGVTFTPEAVATRAWGGH